MIPLETTETPAEINPSTNEIHQVDGRAEIMIYYSRCRKAGDADSYPATTG